MLQHCKEKKRKFFCPEEQRGKPNYGNFKMKKEKPIVKKQKQRKGM